MPNVWESTIEDIERLDDRQLTDLLGVLIAQERRLNSTNGADMSVYRNIDTPDGGLDGLCRLPRDPVADSYLPGRSVGFQCKATEMPKGKCAKELIDRGTRTVKSEVHKCLEEGGVYVLFCRQAMNGKGIDERIEAMRNALRKAKTPYAESAQLKIYDANKIASWTNQYIQAQMRVMKHVGRAFDAAICTWEEWQRLHPGRMSYVSSEQNDPYLSLIRTELQNPGKCIRIVGLSGLGKTRLALEALKPSNGERAQTDPVTSSCIYCKCAEGDSGLLDAMLDWLRGGKGAIIVADDCSAEIHQRLAEVVQATESKMSLLTLDYEPQDRSGARSIELKPLPESAIRKMLKAEYPKMDSSDLQRIVSIAHGFPQIAEFLARARLNNEPDIGSLNDKVLFERILWGRAAPDPLKRKVLTAFALFSRVKVGDRNTYLDAEAEFVREQVTPDITTEDFYAGITFWEDKSLLDRRGRYVRVIPDPVAVNLAAEWWKQCLPARANKLVTSVIAMPGGLGAALGERLSKLDYLPKAQGIAQLLTSPLHPFGRAEVLNTEQGSQLFRSLAEVNPEAAIVALERVFGSMTTEELLEIGAGRRNLVWALEALCWHPECFHRAARLLLAFADAENEKWSNNASGIFAGKFLLLLSGTRTPGVERLEIIDEALRHESDRRRELAVKALETGLTTHHFIRMGGTDQQGSHPRMPDWYPQSENDARGYYAGCLERLANIASAAGEAAGKAQSVLAQHAVAMVRHGLVQEIQAAVDRVATVKGPHWPELLKSVQFELAHRGDDIESEVTDILKSWETRFSPQNLEARLELLVCGPTGWNSVRDKDGNWVDLSEQETKKLAHEMRDWERTLLPLLGVLFQGDIGYGYIFGHEMASVIPDGERERWIDACLREFKAAGDSRNGIVLGGYLRALSPIQPTLVDRALQRIAEDDVLVRHLVDLVDAAGVTVSNLKLVRDAFGAGKIEVGWLRRFVYGRPLERVPQEDLFSFLREVRAHSIEGAWVALDILSMWEYSERGSGSRWAPAKELLREIAMQEGLLENAPDDRMALHHWQEAAVRLLKEQPADSEFAETVARRILALCKVKDDLYRNEHDIGAVILALLGENHRDAVWPLFGEVLLSDNYRDFAELESLLRSSFGFNKDEAGIIETMPDDFLIEWCRNNGPKAAGVLAKLSLVLHEKSDGEKLWTGLATRLMDEFGDKQELIDGLERRMGSFSWSGSAVPHLQRRQKAFQSLTGHGHGPVREWARAELKSIERRIERERKRDEERELGIH